MRVHCARQPVLCRADRRAFAVWRCILAPDPDRGSEDPPPEELSTRLERLRSNAAASTSVPGAFAGPGTAQGGYLLFIVRTASCSPTSEECDRQSQSVSMNNPERARVKR